MNIYFIVYNNGEFLFYRKIEEDNLLYYDENMMLITDLLKYNGYVAVDDPFDREIYRLNDKKLITDNKSVVILIDIDYEHGDKSIFSVRYMSMIRNKLKMILRNDIIKDIIDD